MDRSVAAVRARWQARLPGASRPRRRPGAPYGPRKVPPELVAEIAAALVETHPNPCRLCGHPVQRRATYPELAERFGVTVEQVRTVKRNLDLLAG